MGFNFCLNTYDFVTDNTCIDIGSLDDELIDKIIFN